MGKRVTHQNRQTEHVKEGQDRSGGIAGPHRWKHHDDSIRTPFKPFEDAFPTEKSVKPTGGPLLSRIIVAHPQKWPSSRERLDNARRVKGYVQQTQGNAG